MSRDPNRQISISEENVMSDEVAPEVRPGRALPRLPIAAIQEAVKDIKFGVVQLIIQDGIIIQIDKTEKIRLKPPAK